MFNPSIPQANQLLSNSQGDLLANMTALDTVYGIDHYKFSDGTTNSGFHNTVTTPVVTPNPTMPPYTHPTTLAGLPKFYGMQDSANLGVIQYSRGPSNAVPSPVTFLQSPATQISILAGLTSNVFDFTGLARAMASLYVMDTVTLQKNETGVWWTGATLIVTNFVSGALIGGQVAGNILQIKNGSLVTQSNIYWSLQFLRTT